MSEATIDQMIDKAMNDAPAKDAPSHATPKPAPDEKAHDVVPHEAPESDEGDDLPEANIPFPKKAVNAISRRDKQLNKYRAEKAEREHQMNDEAFIEKRYNELKAKKTAPAFVANPADPEPDIAKYQDFTKYQDDRQDWRARQKAAADKATQAAQPQSQDRAWVPGRERHMDTQANELIAKHPELIDAVHENADILSGFAQPIKDAFLKADNAILAIAVLASEGTLEDLADMSPALAEKTIKRAADRGLKQMPQSLDDDTQDGQDDLAAPAKQVSSAPIPMAPARTSGTSNSKRGAAMPEKDFRKTFMS